MIPDRNKKIHKEEQMIIMWVNIKTVFLLFKSL